MAKRTPAKQTTLSTVRGLLLAGILIGTSSHAEETAVSRDEVVATVKRSLPFIEERGNWWIKAKKCVSCHRVAFMPWAFREAHEIGVDVKPAKLKELTEKSLQKTGGKKNADGLSQLLLGRDAKADAANYSPLAQIIAETQEANGSWKPAGQLPAQKRPKLETRHVSTLWNALALSTIPGDKYKSHIDKARQFIGGLKKAQSTEWYTVRMLVANRFESTAEKDKWLEQLLKHQNADGGWGWLVGQESDALATGQVLYALREIKLDTSHKSALAAQAWLVKSQQANGTWKVKGTKANKKDKFEETAIYWGTAWAAIGLSRSLPQAK